MKRYFVTGIGTGVGKTLTSAILTEALQADYWKPVQTGPPGDHDRIRVKHLVTNSKTVFFKESYSFAEPASPHLAASLQQQTIREDQIHLPVSSNDSLIIEGAGGLLVPLNAHFFVIGLAKQFDAEVILVCRNYLGCINHSLLSMEYLLKNKFKIKGLVLNGDFDPLVRSALVEYAPIPVLAEFREISEVTPESVKRLSKKINLKQFA